MVCTLLCIGASMKRKRYHQGFTLLETMVVVSVIGMMASLAIPYWAKSTQVAQMDACISQQRRIYEAVAQYELEKGRTLDSIATDGAAIRDTLLTNGYFTQQIYFECPSSRIKDYDDYNLQYIGTTLQGTVCTIYPTTHVAQ